MSVWLIAFEKIDFKQMAQTNLGRPLIWKRISIIPLHAVYSSLISNWSRKLLGRLGGTCRALQNHSRLSRREWAPRSSKRALIRFPTKLPFSGLLNFFSTPNIKKVTAIFGFYANRNSHIHEFQPSKATKNVSEFWKRWLILLYYILPLYIDRI